MVIIITGATHSGKTSLSQKLLERLKIPYLSIDHLKMGLIRSDNTNLTIKDSDKLTEYLWPIVREIIKTAIENNQNLIIEGLYVPFKWRDDFQEEYLKEIKYFSIIFSEQYIKDNFNKILQHSNTIENRLDTSYLNKEKLIKEHNYNLKMSKNFNLDYLLVKEDYRKEIDNWIEENY